MQAFHDPNQFNLVKANKNTKMKNTRFFTALIVTTLVSTSMVIGQNRQNGAKLQKQKGHERFSRLDDAQKSSLKEIHAKYGVELKQMKLEMAEMQAQQKTLFGNANPNESKLVANAQDMAEMQGEMSKKMLAMRLEMKAIVKPEGDMMGRAGFHQKDGAKKGDRKPMQGKQGRGDMKKGSGERQEMAQAVRRSGNKEFAGNGKANKQSNKGDKMRKNRSRKEGKEAGNFFTDEQHLAMQNLRMANHQQVTDLKNQLNELQVHQKNILAQNEVNVKAANKNIDAMTKLKSELAGIQVKSKLEMQSLLSDEQKAKMSMRKSGKRMHPRGQGFRG